MTHDLQVGLWGSAVLGALLLNTLTKRDADSVGVAGMLVAGWCVSRVVSVLYTVPDSMRFYPAQDALFAIVVFSAFLSRPAAWKLALTGLFIFQLCLHTAFWYAWDMGHRDALPFYREVNNCSFALELLAVSWGAIMDVAGDVIRRVPRWGRSFHLRKAGR